MARAAGSTAGLGAVFLIFSLSLIVPGCSGPPGGITGRVECTRVDDSVRVDYDLRLPFRADEVDSVAIQLLPDEKGLRLWYSADRRVKDSLYRSLEDTVDCCLPYRASMPSDTGDCGHPPCWWTVWPDSVQYWPYCFVPAYYEYMASPPTGAALDSLRRESIPCWWKVDLDSYDIDTILQRDEVVYRQGDDPEHSRLKLQGVMSRSLEASSEPGRYAVLIYRPGKREYIHDLFSDYPLSLWEGVFPATPRVSTYRFRDQGKGLGMTGGIGSVIFEHAPIASGKRSSEYSLDLYGGLLYYTPTTVYELSGEFRGFDTTDSGGSHITYTLLGIRHYPYTGPSRGISYYGTVELLEYFEQVGIDTVRHIDWGIGWGVGYDTDYDRITYAYHTGRGGFHEVSFLLGYEAIQLGKAGLKLTWQRGPTVRNATIQACMENRLMFDTMMLPRPRPFLKQLLAWSGMVGVWALLD